jgi:hypothetical protein
LAPSIAIRTTATTTARPQSISSVVDACCIIGA